MGRVLAKRLRAYIAIPSLPIARAVGVDCCILNVQADSYDTDFTSLYPGPEPPNPATYTGKSVSPTPATSPAPTAPPVSVWNNLSFEEYWCAYLDRTAANKLGDYPNFGTVVDIFDGFNNSQKTYCLSLEKADYNSWSATATDPGGPAGWTPTKTSPCCNTFCNIEASAAQLFYWPTPAPPSLANRTTIVGSDGFT